MAILKKKMYLGAFSRLLFQKLLVNINNFSYEIYLENDNVLNRDIFDDFIKRLPALYLFTVLSKAIIERLLGKIKYDLSDIESDVSGGFWYAIQDLGLTKEKIHEIEQTIDFDKYTAILNNPETDTNNLLPLMVSMICMDFSYLVQKNVTAFATVSVLLQKQSYLATYLYDECRKEVKII